MTVVTTLKSLMLVHRSLPHSSSNYRRRAGGAPPPPVPGSRRRNPRRLSHIHNALGPSNEGGGLGSDPANPRGIASSGSSASSQPDGDSNNTQAATRTTMRQIKQQLQAAVDREDYAEAAVLRDKLGEMGGEAINAVEEANAAFYRAFEAMNFNDMEQVWGFGDHVQCIHPGTGCIAGREDVLNSWRHIFAPAAAGAPGLQIDVTDVRVRISDSMAFVTCTERVDAAETGGKLAATNIFEYDSDNKCWRMVMHHASPCP